MHNASIMGTDQAPPCPYCAGTVAIYRLIANVSYAIATCGTCHARAVLEWTTTGEPPTSTARELRAHHQAERAAGRAHPSPAATWQRQPFTATGRRFVIDGFSIPEIR